MMISQHWLDNGLAQNRRQAIILSKTNDGSVYWCIYAAADLDELNIMQSNLKSSKLIKLVCCSSYSIVS